MCIPCHLGHCDHGKNCKTKNGESIGPKCRCTCGVRKIKRRSMK